MARAISGGAARSRGHVPHRRRNQPRKANSRATRTSTAGTARAGRPASPARASTSAADQAPAAGQYHAGAGGWSRKGVAAARSTARRAAPTDEKLSMTASIRELAGEASTPAPSLPGASRGAPVAVAGRVPAGDILGRQDRPAGPGAGSPG